MNKNRIIEILEAYRPGEGLESDPEVLEALELAAQDPDLARKRDAIQAFDDAFGEQLRAINVPADLKGRILAASPSATTPPETGKPATGRIIAWLHPAAFAVAASIIMLFALSFTFLRSPTPSSQIAAPPPLAIAETPLMQTASSLYKSLRPRFRPTAGSETLGYLEDHGGALPVSLPFNSEWDNSFACDVVDVNGAKVSIICFTAPDQSHTIHLFTFHRSDFPGV